MSSPAPKLLVISNPDDRVEIESLLGDAGFGDARFGDGGDACLAELDGTEVVILFAALDHGDSRALAAEIRSADPAIAIVLIGQPDGPIRNALDASDFEVDHFLTRPLSPKALRYVVASGAAAAGERRAAASSGPGNSSHRLSERRIDSRARTQSVIGEVVDQAIDDFLDEAIAALPPTPRAATDAVPRAAPDEPTGKAPIEAAAGAGSAGAFAAPDALEPRSEDDSQPEWREETMVLGPDGGSGRQANAPAEIADEPPTGGAFARELRQKMSKMAERLFPDDDDRAAATFGISHGANTEIDLSSLGGGNTIIGDADDDDDDAMVTRVPFDPSETGTQPRAMRPREEARGSVAAPGNDVASLLARLFDLGVTGRIAFEGEGASKTIFLDRGRPVFASSNLPHDRMGDMLFREGKLTRAQHVRSRELYAESGKRMGEVLVAEGFLKPRELMPAIRRHLEELIYSLFGWREGEYRVVEDVLPSSEQIRLTRHPAALVLEGIRRKYDLGRLFELLGSEQPVVELTEAERALALAQQIELLPAEERALRHFDGRATVREVAEAAGSDLLSVAQVGFALVALGAAQTLGTHDSDQEDTVEAPALSGPSDAGIDRERIQAKYRQVVESDYFQLLGVRRDATPFEIRRAYERVCRDFAPGTFDESLQGELRTELSEIAAVVTEAYAVLSSDSIRASYLANLRD